MEAVTIHDVRPHGDISVLAFDLADLLALAGPAATSSSWACAGVECLGPGADAMHAAADAGPIPGQRLAELAAGVTQTIDGTFAATRPGEAGPWLVLKAIDSSYFVVVTRDCHFLAAARARFRDVRPSPDDAAWYG